MLILCVALVALASVANGQLKSCGQAPGVVGDLDARVVNGHQSADDAWPFVCSLQQRPGGSHFCGGQLIQNTAGVYYFLTAAHCVTNGQHNSYQMRCATNNRNGETGSQLLYFSNVYRHPQYNPNTLNNDVAILTLSTQPVNANNIGPVCIASTPEQPGINGVVMGWGTTSSGGGTLPIMLLEGHKPVVSDADCTRAYGSEFNPTTMMCAGMYGGSQTPVDACQGDSGGPYVKYRHGRWELIGVVSWGYGCADPRYPGVYADAYYYRNWISTQIGGLNNS